MAATTDGADRSREQARDRSREQARELERELERVADRLRVLGPRLAARSGPGATADDAAATLARVRGTLQLLADLAADAQRRPRRAVPELAPHGLADQLVVLGHDVLDVLDVDDLAALDPGPGDVARAALVELRRAL